MKDARAYQLDAVTRGGSAFGAAEFDRLVRFLSAMYREVGKENFVAYVARSGYNVGTGSIVIPLGGLSTEVATITGSAWSENGLVSVDSTRFANASITLNPDPSTLVAVYSDNVFASTSGITVLAGGDSSATVGLLLLGNNGGSVTYRGTRGGSTWSSGTLRVNATGWNVAVAVSKSGDQRLTHNNSVVSPTSSLTGASVALPFFRFAPGISGGIGSMTQAVAMLINGETSYSTVRSIIASTIMEDIPLPA